MNFQLSRQGNSSSIGLQLSAFWHVIMPIVLMVSVILLFSSISNRLTGIEGSSFHTKNDISQGDVLVLQKKLAGLEAESLRLRAFAQKIVELAKLDSAVFAFDRLPAQGGVIGRNLGELKRGLSSEDLDAELEGVKKLMKEHNDQLERVQLMIRARQLDDESISYWPVSKGYISSHYGLRKDPFSGRQRRHRGLDIAGPRGTAVKSIASGEVIFSARQGGFGRMIEIQHAGGLVSRYAHLDKILVKKGQRINAGELIGRLGSSGRSTGPHLHLEILKNNKNVNPMIYLSKESFLGQK